MEEDIINVDDICNSFLVTAMYGKNPNDWPRKTIAVCKIICTDKNGGKWVSLQIYKNDSRHAEVKLIEYLRWLGNALKARKIRINIYMNYSPCSDCAKIILGYIKEMKSLKREIEMTITFANFYKTHEYTYKKMDGTEGGNSRENACLNIKGLKELHKENGVKLRLLGVHVKWERFLDMICTEEEKVEWLDEANSQERKDREEFDKKFWDDKILGMEGATQKLKTTTISDESEDGNSD